MTNRQELGSGIEHAIWALVDRQETITNRDVVEALGGSITRQAVHYHLRRLVESGVLLPEGSGRGRRYRRKGTVIQRHSIDGLAEHEVWRELLGRVPFLQGLPGNVEAIISYAFTEMLNNAIDHSGSELVELRLWDEEPHRVAFAVIDEGVGVFQHVSQRLGLGDLREAVGELSKGKLTTQPERHTGEGIFFTSKAVDRFVLESDSLRWTVDNRRGDQALGDVASRKGTFVESEVDKRTARDLRRIFDRYTGESFDFSRSSVMVKLFEVSTGFVSRSEAKRLAARLEEFEHVLLDFSGVQEVGQGFVDELFRVWAGQHPETRLEPVNMLPAVEFMVRRGLRS
ncbi:MAG: STAS-like domain-containing protein [Acidimicrobiia bacterium]